MMIIYNPNMPLAIRYNEQWYNPINILRDLK